MFMFPDSSLYTLLVAVALSLAIAPELLSHPTKQCTKYLRRRTLFFKKVLLTLRLNVSGEEKKVFLMDNSDQFLLLFPVLSWSSCFDVTIVSLLIECKTKFTPVLLGILATTALRFRERSIKPIYTDPGQSIVWQYLKQSLE